MKNLRRNFVGSALFVAGASLASQNAFALTVLLSGRHILSGQSIEVEVYDRVCKRPIGVFTVMGNANVPISVCPDSTGKGDVATRDLTNRGDWSGHAFLRENEQFYP